MRLETIRGKLPIAGDPLAARPPPRFKVNGDSNTSVWIIDTWKHGVVLDNAELAFITFSLAQVTGPNGADASIESVSAMAQAYADLLNDLLNTQVVRT
jgi:hypothetical protein